MTSDLRRIPAKPNAPAVRPRVLVMLAWYATGVFRGLAHYARDAGWILDSNFERAGTVPEHWQGDGIIAVLGVSPAVDRFVAKRKLPTVNIGYSLPGKHPRVAAHQEAIGQLAADHFCQRGFRHFAYFMRSRHPGDTGRYKAFQKALGDARRVHLLDWPAWSADKGEGDDLTRLRWLGSKLAKLPQPIAVFAEIDDYAIEVIEAAQLAGLKIPEQIAVLGVGNDELRCPFAAVPLSSVDDNPHGIGYQAAALLDWRMSGHGSDSGFQSVTPSGVVARQSTDLLAVDHPLVAQALRIIHERFREPVTAEGLISAVPMSRRRLHDAFLHYIGRSAAEELMRVRMERARELLLTTDEKLEVVARESGFATASHLHEVFNRTLKLTPGAYRKKFGVEREARSSHARAGRPPATNQP